MIPTSLHAALDGLSATALIAGPRALGWRRGLCGPMAAAGAGVAAYSLLTRYREGSAAPLSMDHHLALDALQGAGFCAAAALLDDEPLEVRAALAGYGAFSLVAVLLTDRPEEMQRRGGGIGAGP